METIDHGQRIAAVPPSRMAAPGKRVYRWDWTAGAWTDTGARRPPAPASRAAAVGQRARTQRVSTPGRPGSRTARPAPPSNRGPVAPRLEDPPPRRRRLEVLAPLLFGALCVLILALLSLTGEA